MPEPQLLGPDGQPVKAPESSSSGSATPPIPPAASDFAKAEDVARLNDTINRLQGVVEGIGRVAQPPAPPAHRELSDSDINAAIRSALEDGTNPAETVRALVDQAASRHAERVEAKLRTLENYGSANFAAIAEANMASRANYKRFEREIKAELDKVDPALKGSPLAWDYAYNLVLGRHAHELANEAAEQAVRQAREQGALNPPPTGIAPEPAKLKDGRPAPTAVELGGQVAADALAYRKLNEEDLAKRTGAKDWASYVDQLSLQDPYEDDDFVKRGINRKAAA